MITYFFLKFIATIIAFVISPLPTITELPFNLDAALTTIYSLVHSATTVFPFIGVAMGWILLALSIEVAFYTWLFIAFVIKFIRGA